MLQALGSLLSSVHESGQERLRSLLLYLLKKMKGDMAFPQLQLLCQRIAQQPDHPMHSCIAEVFAAPAAAAAAEQESQQQQQLPLDPFTQLPQYQQLQQLLSQAAAFPVSAAALLRSKVQQMANSPAAAATMLAAVTRQLYLPKGVAHSSSQAEKGLLQVSHILKQLLQEQHGQMPAKQLLLSLLSNQWHTVGAASSSTSCRSAAGSGMLLQLHPGASQQQLYLCSIAMHLAQGLLSSASNKHSSTAAAAAGGSKGVSSSSSGGIFAAPLLLYLTDPAAAQQQYMLGLPGDEATQLLNVAGAAGQATTAFRCQCGMPYLIGECGRPAQELRCPSPNCTFSLGGSSHIPAAGQTQVGTAGQVPLRQQRGFISTLIGGTVDSPSGSTGSSSSGGSGSRIWGCCGDSAALAAAASAGVRSLTPSSCQLLRLLVHTALFVGSAAQLQPSGALCGLLGVRSEAVAQQQLQQIVCQQWQLLLISCQATEEQLLAVVHCAVHAMFAVAASDSSVADASSSSSSSSSRGCNLCTEAGRAAWEEQFQQQVANPFTQNPAKALKQLLAAQQSTGGAATTESATAGATMFIQCAVQEVLDVSVDPTYRTLHLPTLFRSVAAPSLDVLAAQFWSDASNAQHYPVTAAVLQELQQQHLQLLPHLHILVSFEAAFRLRCSGMLSRATAGSVTLKDFLSQLTAGSTAAAAATSKESTNSPLSPQHGLQFLQAWNAVGPIVTRHECRDISVPVLDSRTAPAAVACLTGQDEGRLLAALLAELAQRQNAFLQAATQQQQRRQQQQHAEGNPIRQQHLATTPVQSAKPSGIVDFPAAMQQLQQQLAPLGSGLAWPGLEYGAGQTLHFDLQAVEQLLHGSVVEARAS
jgi:hypothetical protein